MAFLVALHLEVKGLTGSGEAVQSVLVFVELEKVTTAARKRRLLTVSCFLEGTGQWRIWASIFPGVRASGW